MKAERLRELKEQLGDGKNVKFRDLVKICTELFGEPRNTGTSHHVFKTPWFGDPRVNLQPDGKEAKRYQVRQVQKAIEKLEEHLKERKEKKESKSEK